MTFTALDRFKKNSPSTTIAAPGISDSATTIPVTELSVFHDATGLITEGIVISRNNATETATEEIKITGASATSGAGNLTGATRGVSAHGTNGAAAAWIAGTLISCQISSTMMNRIKDDLDDLNTNKAVKAQIHPIQWLPQQMNFDVPPSMGGNGATITYEKLSSGIVQGYMEFTNTSIQYVFCEGVLPEDWDSAAVDITAYLRWKTASASTNKVKWLIKGKRFTSGASRDFAVSDLLATIEQANGGAEFQNETSETTLVDMTGTGRNFVLMITRDYATESPSLAASAGLLSGEVYCTRTLV